jgi:mannose-1-phosphate guanylyltransferase
MIAVIVAGGSGTRLWPLSKPDYPKHLLKINGDELSLLQATYERAKLVADKIYVVSEVGHIKFVKQQLPDLPDSAFITEPGRRGTANCIVAALAAITEDKVENEPIAFMHADHYIRDTGGFEYSFHVANNAAGHQARIVLVGVEPDYPSTGFGYIKKGTLQSDDGHLIFSVESFHEKPSHKLARQYWRSGDYLWNCGYFVATLDVFVSSMEQHAPNLYANYQKLCQTSKETYDETYLSFESEAIDYALIEKVDNLLVVPASFDWMDLGSFYDMHKAIGGDEEGNHVHGRVELEKVQNSFIQNYEDKPVAVIGLDNVVVINTPHGVAVIRKDLSQKIGDVSKRFTQQ